MHTTDIERMRAQVRRTVDKANEIIEEGDTIGDAGFDPSNSNKVLEQQKELVSEVAQTLSDFNELLNRVDSVESDTVEYSPNRSSVSITYDDTSQTVEISYTGNKTVPNSEVTVLKSGSEISPFSGADITSGDTATVDVSSMSNGELVEIKVTQNRVSTGHNIRSWEEVLGKSGATPPTINAGDITLPEHNLTKDVKTMTKSVTVGNTNNTI